MLKKTTRVQWILPLLLEEGNSINNDYENVADTQISKAVVENTSDFYNKMEEPGVWLYGVPG